MIYKKEIKIEAFLPQSAELKAEHAEFIANTLDDDNMRFVAGLCRDKGRSINTSLRSNAKLIKSAL